MVLIITVAAAEQNLPDTTGPDGLNAALVLQLRLCLAAVDTKQSDVTICKWYDTDILIMCLRSSTTAQGGGHEIWETIWEMVKAMSEVLLSSLPNFWKVAKNFLEGKFKRVRSCRNLLLYQF